MDLFFWGDNVKPFLFFQTQWSPIKFIYYIVQITAHYSVAIMSSMASQITSISSVCSAVCSGEHQRKHQSSASLGFVRGMHWCPVDSPHKGPAKQKILPFDDVIMNNTEYKLDFKLTVVACCLCGAKPLSEWTNAGMLSGGWVGLWGFLWWAPSAKRKDHHGVSSGWSSVWHRSNTGLSSTQYEQIPIILGVWPFWLTPFFFRSITFWRAYG